MMQGIRLSDLAESNNAILYGEDAEVSGLFIDSRQVCSGGLFVAISGEHVDGHDFLTSALNNGAVGAIVERKQDAELAQIVVDNSVSALANVARYNREKFQGHVVAITGSAGKTTCKNMLASILAQSHRVCATAGNHNNELGVPLTVQLLSEQHDIAVIEMGAAQQGDIAYLVDIAKPEMTVVTNVAEAHIGRFGDLSITAKTKGEIYKNLNGQSVAVINRDDSFADLWRADIQSNEESITVVEYSLHDKSADIFVNHSDMTSVGIDFKVTINVGEKSRTLDISLPLLGAHNIANALAAISLANALSVTDQDIVSGLSQMTPEQGRLQRCCALNELVLIDDSYNANPLAMMSAIDVLNTLRAANNKASILVLGDMGELGYQAEEKHTEVGCYAANQKIDYLLATGEYAEQYVKGFKQVCDLQNNNNGQAFIFESKKSIAEHLLTPAFSGCNVLVKGSRTSAMDEVVTALQVNSEGENLC